MSQVLDMFDRSFVMGGTEVVMWARSMRRRNLAAGTIEKRRSVARRLSVHASKPLIAVSGGEIEAWLDGRNITPRSRYADISHVATFFEWAIREGLTDTDPTRRIDRPKVNNGLPRPIDTVDLDHAISQAPTTQIRAMLLLASLGGLRCGEIAALTGGDIMGGMMLIHGKGGKQRIVPLNPLAAEAVSACRLSAHGSVFGMKPHQVSHAIRRHLHDCGVVASAHQLRHWFATSVYEASGHDLRMVQDLLGHSSPTTTAIYTQWSRSQAGPVVDSLGA